MANHRARIYVNGETIHLGMFFSKEEADEACLDEKARIELGWDPTRKGRFKKTRGVSYNKVTGMYQVAFSKNKKRLYFGAYKTEKEALQVRDDARAGLIKARKR